MVQRAGGHFVELQHAAGLPARGVDHLPIDLHPHHVAGGALGGNPALHHEIGAGIGVLHHRAETRQLAAELTRQRGVAVAGGAVHALEEHPRRPVHQAVGVALPPRRLDAGEQRGDVGGGGLGHKLQRLRRGLGPAGAGHGGALGGALVLAFRVLHGEHRHHLGAAQLGAGHQPPVAVARRHGHRGHLAGLQCGGQCRRQGAAGGIRQQRRGGCRHRQPRRRRLRQPQGGRPGIAHERARQVAAAGQQRRQQQQNPTQGHGRPRSSAGSAPAASN